MIRVANAPCSWGAMEFDLAGDVPAAERVLDEMAGQPLASAQRSRAYLRKRGA